MKVKTSELSGKQLDWAVTRANFEVNYETVWRDCREECNFSIDWAHGGPIIERECIEISCIHTTGWTPNTWTAQHPQRHRVSGPTPLIAAMRCYVVSKLGTEVEVPEMEEVK